MIVQKQFLQRKQSKHVTGILADIGQIIEQYVQERSVAADAWQRTGVLTFDGISTVKQSVTYSRIKSHLEDMYKRKFGYGTSSSIMYSQELTSFIGS